jgi:hypothetical protein
LEDRERWVIPLEGKVGDALPGDCLLLQPGDRAGTGGRMLIGATA